MIIFEYCPILGLTNYNIFMPNIANNLINRESIAIHKKSQYKKYHSKNKFPIVKTRESKNNFIENGE